MIENEPQIPVSRLYGELLRTRAAGASSEGELEAPNRRTDLVVNSVLDGLFPGEEFTFDESVVKGNLDEILLLCIALRDRETHGKGLMEDLGGLFDASLSPGTVYPRLHDLTDDDLLEMHALVRTKEYAVADQEGVRARLEDTMRQHLALGFILHAALDELDN